jgi:uncharacterized membrane protein YkvI
MTSCSGPCLKHCSCSTKTKILAYVAIVYTLSCIVYLIITRKMETPFLDSLTTEQLKIKNRSSKDRKCVFIISLVIAILVSQIIKQIK